MEASKAELGVLDYSASQPPLESVFLAFVHNDGRASVRASVVDSASGSPNGLYSPWSSFGMRTPTLGPAALSKHVHRFFAKAEPRVRAFSMELSSTRQDADTPACA